MRLRLRASGSFRDEAKKRAWAGSWRFLRPVKVSVLDPWGNKVGATEDFSVGGAAPSNLCGAWIGVSKLKWD